MRRFALMLLAAAMTAAGVWAQPKYIFFFIGDGMGNGPVVAAYQYNRMVRQQDRPLLMTTFPTVGIATTYSASSPVTDSTAAGTALATGYKTLNNMMSMTPDTVAVTSIAERLRDAGWGIGIVTTVSADDATPGVFYAHQPSRKNYYEIGVQAAESGVEFLAGAGLRGFQKDGEPTDLQSHFDRAGIKLVRGAEGLRGVDSRRVILLGTDTVVNWNVGYTIDSVPGALTLQTMTDACIEHMQRVSPERFFMMVEGGNIDHAGHSNDGGAMIKEVVNFDKALESAYRFYLEHPDETLIVVTADHDTGGFSLGNQAIYYNARLDLIDHQRKSKDIMASEVKGMLMSRRIYTWEDMKEYLRDNLGLFGPIGVSEKQEAALHESFDRTFQARDGQEEEALYNTYPQFVADVFKLYQDLIGIGWTTTYHTGNPVPVYAVGVGAELFSGYIDNTAIPVAIMRAAGVE